ncbi:hypothetical protein OEZ85_004591 [Tetradesmus obliquus]|uniref:Reticulon-like protein n=1 Tax=Tetradesmus obliquus TaxID=3088 RepID=A0ABY8ULC8_TETOB|nr:hypothetical protein OEZ85_004591 [Tetradesmus obliquus]
MQVQGSSGASSNMYECLCGFAAATATAMHKHLTSPEVLGARHEHRLKTTLLSKASSGSQQQHSQQQYSQQQYSQQQRHGGSSPALHTLTAAAAGGAAGRTGGAAGNNPSAVQGYAAVTGSAAVDFGYQQGWESVDRHYTSQQQELPTSRHASSTAAGISARMDRSSAKQSSGQQQQQQQQQENPATSSFGVRISGSVMAAFNGWMVNQAVNAATAAVTTALAGDSPSASSPAAAAAAAAGASRRDEPVRWSLGGFLRQSVSPAAAGDAAAAAAAAGAGGGGKRSKSKLAAVAAEDPYMNYLVGSGSGSSKDEAAADGADLQDVDLGSSSSDEEGEVEHNQQQQQQQGEAEADALRPLLSSEDEGAGAAAAAAARRKGARRRRQAAAAAAAAGSIAAARQWAAGGEVTAQGEAEGSGFVFVGRPGVGSKVKVLRGLLLWHSKAASVKALGFGLYMVLLLGSIPRGLDYMQLTTLLPGLALLYLAYNMAKPWAIRGYCCAAGKSAQQLSARLATFEASAADRLIAICCRLAAEAGLWALAALALGHRALRGRKFTTSCWTVLSLWLLLLVSELRIMSQTLLAMLAYAGLFSVPWLYSKFRPVIDAVVYDGLHLLTLLVVHAERWAYVLAALAAALVWQMMASADGSGSLVVQGSAAAGAGLAVLVWRVAVAES